MTDTLNALHYSEAINDDENSITEVSVDNTNPVPSHGENTKEFLNFNYNNYKAINVAQPNKTNIEEFGLCMGCPGIY